MISLRKHIDRADAPLPPQPNAVAVDSGDCLSAYTEVLVAVGQSAQKAVPGVGADLCRNLSEIAAELKGSGGIPVPTRERVGTELSQWADRALNYHEKSERNINQIMDVVALAAESIGKRDERHGKEIGDLTTRLRTIAELKDLAPIRRSILDSTEALRACVEKLTEENKATVTQLSAQVVLYQKMLEESEKTATLDPLTGIANRRAFEQQLERRITAGAQFSLIMLDLNDFKGVNDRFGHVAGDSLLSQFADELRSQFRANDLVGRWGGDEFVVIVEGGLAEAEARAGRVRQWALGEYTLDAGARKVKTLVNAAIGVVEWDRVETGIQLLDRADQKLYNGKSRGKVETREPQLA